MKLPTATRIREAPTTQLLLWFNALTGATKKWPTEVRMAAGAERLRFWQDLTAEIDRRAPP